MHGEHRGDGEGTQEGVGRVGSAVTLSMPDGCDPAGRGHAPRSELLLVLALSLGANAVGALISFIGLVIENSFVPSCDHHGPPS